MSFTDDKTHFLAFAKKIFKTDKWLPILNHFYFKKTQCFMDGDLDKVSDYIYWGHLIANAIDYDLYRQSHHWIDLRNRTLDKYKQCHTCSRPSEVMHHNKYHGVLFKEQIGKDVIALCNKCHSAIHEKSKVANYYELKKIN